MANQKEYSIKINGIKESINDTSSLGDKLNSLNEGMKSGVGDVNNYTTSIKGIKKEIKAIQDEMAGLDKGSKAWTDLAKKAGDLKDRVDDIRQATARFASDTKALDDAINLAKSATSVFGVLQGAMSEFGVESEGAAEAIKKLQATMTILTSLQQLQNSLRGSSATAELLTRAMKLLGIGMNGATTATKAFRIALSSIGIGIAIALITTLYENWDKLASKIGLATEAQKKANQMFEVGAKAYDKASAELEVVTAKVNAFNGSKEQEKQLVDELNSKYRSAFGHYKTLAEWKVALTKKTDAYCKSLANEAEIQALVNELSENRKKQREIDEEIANGGSAWNQFLDDITPWSDPNAVEKSEKGKDKLVDQAKEIKAEIKSLVEENNKIAQDSELFNFAPTIEKNGKKSIDKAKEVAKKIAEEWVKAERDTFNIVQSERDADAKKEEENKKKLLKLAQQLANAELENKKARLKYELEITDDAEKQKRIKEEILEIERKQKEEALKISAAEALGISQDELNQRLLDTEGRFLGLNEEQKLILKTLLEQLNTIKVAAETAKKSINGVTPPTSGGTDDQGDNKKSSWGYGDKLGKLGIDNGGFGEGMARLGEKAEAANELLHDTIIDPMHEAFSMLAELAVEEAQEALDEVSALYDQAQEKTEESRNRLTEIENQMQNASGARLEQLKAQQADEMAMMAERDAEEKRLEKEKEKREKELEKKKKKQRKQELTFQLINAITSNALAIVKALTAGPILGPILASIIGAMGAIQIGVIQKQMSKLADGGLLQGKSHREGGIPVGNTGIEVEGGEFVVSKRATAKYLPLLDAINAEGNGGKHVINSPKSMFGDSGQLNYQRIDDNFNQLNGTAAIARSIEAIDFHPVVSVVDINRGQKDLVQVREMAGGNN